MLHYRSAARVLLSLLLCLTSSLSFTSKHSNAAGDAFLLRDKTSATLRVALERNTVDYFLFQATPTGYQLELTHRFAARLGRGVEILPVKSPQEGFAAVEDGRVDFYATSRPMNDYPHTLLACSLSATKSPTAANPLPSATWLFAAKKSNLLANASLWFASKPCRNLTPALACKYGENGYMRYHYEKNRSSEPSLSVYDSLIKKAAEPTRWDWRWIASIIYQESRFKPTMRSPRGAYGLMQMTPITAQHFRVPDLSTPEAQINAGVNYLVWLDEQFEEMGIPLAHRNDFILAAYNAGYSKIRKAQRNAIALGASPYVWVGNVAIAHANTQPRASKNTPLTDLYGTGETCNFVRQINGRYAHYKNLM